MKIKHKYSASIRTKTQSITPFFLVNQGFLGQKSKLISQDIKIHLKDSRIKLIIYI